MGFTAVVTSGKGGVGKSTVTCCIGGALAARGNRVLLIDADTGLRSIDIMTGTSEQAVYDISDIFSGRCEPVQAVYPSPIYKNLYVIQAPAAFDCSVSPAGMKRLCDIFAAHFDAVLVDSPAGLGTGFEVAAAGAQRALVVTTPDMVCTRAAAATGMRLQEVRLPARLIINRLRVRPVVAGRMPDVDAVIDAAGIRLIGIVPEDPAVSAALTNGVALPADSRCRACFVNISRRLMGENIPLADLR